MCIRDSQNVTEVLALNRRVAGLAHYDAHLLAASLIARITHDDSAATAHLKQSNPCLLYTSDAADERSSVDLGGRRIIKKKNNKTNTGRQDI